MLLLNKPAGVTSFQALYPVKRTYGPAVGHTGTLDQFAEGLLVILTGKFTRFTPFFTEFDKVYEADFLFGVETSTLDPGGEVVFQGDLPPDEVLLGLADRLRGPLDQIPPQYSAVHIGGKRAYERVRAGETVEIAPRPIVIHELEVVRWSSPILTVRVHCSKGTYIRSLARDWGRWAGCGAHVTRLVRHRVGPFTLPSGSEAFYDTRQTLGLLEIPCLEVPSLEGIRRGLPPVAQVPSLESVKGPRAAIFSVHSELGAVVERRQGNWTYVFVEAGPP